MAEKRIAAQITSADWAQAFAAHLAHTYGLDATTALAISDEIEMLIDKANLRLKEGIIDVPARVRAQALHRAAFRRIAEADSFSEAATPASGVTSYRITSDSWAAALVEQISITHAIDSVAALRLVAQVAAVLDIYGISERPVLVISPWLDKEVRLIPFSPGNH